MGEITKCSKCGKEMIISHQSKNQVLWKCPFCGHMTLVQNWNRDDVGRRKK